MDAERIYADLVRAGEAWADAEAAASLLEETRRTVLAKAMNDAPAASIAAKEMLGLASEEYAKHLSGMVRARTAANKARVRYDSAKILSELRRTEESTRREEMRMGR